MKILVPKTLLPFWPEYIFKIPKKKDIDKICRFGNWLESWKAFGDKNNHESFFEQMFRFTPNEIRDHFSIANSIEVTEWIEIEIEPKIDQITNKYECSFYLSANGLCAANERAKFWHVSVSCNSWYDNRDNIIQTAIKEAYLTKQRNMIYKQMRSKEHRKF